MKLLPLLLAALLATATAQLPADLPKQLSNISMDCREIGVGQRIKTDNSGLLGLLGDHEAREHHGTISIEISNLGRTPVEITPVVYFLVRDASGGEAIQLAASRSTHLVVKPTAPEKWNVDMPSSIEHVDNSFLLGTGTRTGTKPAGWIAGCLTEKAFYPIKASSPTIMDYAQGPDFKAARELFEKKMPKDLTQRQATEVR